MLRPQTHGTVRRQHSTWPMHFPIARLVSWLRRALHVLRVHPGYHHGRHDPVDDDRVLRPLRPLRRAGLPVPVYGVVVDAVFAAILPAHAVLSAPAAPAPPAPLEALLIRRADRHASRWSCRDAAHWVCDRRCAGGDHRVPDRLVAGDPCHRVHRVHHACDRGHCHHVRRARHVHCGRAHHHVHCVHRVWPDVPPQSAGARRRAQRRTCS